VAFLSKKYLRTNFPSLPDSGAPQERQATARSTVSGPASGGDNRTSQIQVESVENDPGCVKTLRGF
jgi:hypothetical protein